MFKFERLRSFFSVGFEWDVDFQGWLDHNHFEMICLKGTKTYKRFTQCYDYHIEMDLEEFKKLYDIKESSFIYMYCKFVLDLIKPALRIFGFDAMFKISEDIVPLWIYSEKSEYVVFVAPNVMLEDDMLSYFDTKKGFAEMSGCKCPEVLNRARPIRYYPHEDEDDKYGKM